MKRPSGGWRRREIVISFVSNDEQFKGWRSRREKRLWTKFESSSSSPVNERNVIFFGFFSPSRKSGCLARRDTDLAHL